MVDAVTSVEMKAVDLNAQYWGVSRIQLMENAGSAVAEEVLARFKSPVKVTVCAGLGGNGGDGLVAARHLAGLGFPVTVILAGDPQRITDGATKQNWECVASLDTVKKFVVYDSSMVPPLGDAKVIIDALLGVGAKGELKPPISELVREMNRSKGFKIAVDVPTGVDADNGKALGAVRADLTVTFHKLKVGLLKAKAHTGEVVTAPIGIPREADLYAGPGDVYLVKKPRKASAHKGEFGRLLVLGGSETYSGAPALAALAALRTGVDLVYIAAPRATAQAIAAISPNFITVKLDGEHLNPHNLGTLEALLGRVDAAVVGPGLGLHKDTVEAVGALLGRALKKPLLLDADALKIVAELGLHVRAPAVLTPHAGEYRLLAGEPPPEDLEERSEHVRRNALKFGNCILLKGHVDVISDGRRVKLNATGNPGMTVGGTGDVLSGIVGALLAQGFDLFEAAVAGAFVNGVAGDLVAKEKGYHMLPTDLVDQIPKVFEADVEELASLRGFRRG